MNGITAYKYYQSLRLHFKTETYDFFKYKTNITITEATFRKKNDRRLFEQLAKRENVPSYILANISLKPYYIKQLLDDKECFDNYNNWKSIIKSLTYHFKNDLAKLSDDFEKEVVCTDQLPLLLERYHGGEITRESLCLIIHHANLIQRWDEDLKDNVIWGLSRLPIVKYLPFVQEKDKYNQLLIEKYPNIK